MTGAAALLEPVADIARQAARVILEIYASGAAAASVKSDASALTAADLRAHELILAALHDLAPDVPVLSEEAPAPPLTQRARWPRHWLVDPLDGTREFLARNGEFTVNIALIEGSLPVLGIVHVPATDVSYRGVPGVGAWRADGGAAARPIRAATHCHSPVRVAGSRSHRGDSLGAFLARLGFHELLGVGSALKFCLVAEGAADVYPRLGPTSEWDTAAGHAVVVGAGGAVKALDGQPLRYNACAELLNPFFVAYGPAEPDWLALLR